MNQAISIIDYSHIATGDLGATLLLQGAVGIVLMALLVGVIIRGVGAESRRQGVAMGLAGGLILALLIIDYAWVKKDYREGRADAQNYLAAELQVPVVSVGQYSRLHDTGREVAIEGSRLCGGDPIVVAGAAGESKIFVLYCMEVTNGR